MTVFMETLAGRVSFNVHLSAPCAVEFEGAVGHNSSSNS